MQWLDGAGKNVVMDLEPASYYNPRLSKDGSRLLYQVLQGSNTDIWIYDWQRGSKTRLTSGGVNIFPGWSPDGRFVVFDSAGGIFWTRADRTGKPQPLIQSKQMQLPGSFFPDGSRLVYSERTFEDQDRA